MLDSALKQSEVFEFLGDARLWGEAPVRIDTPISAVFLVGAQAFKLKKAVRLPFLDYSTIEHRWRHATAELEINRRISPILYHGLKAVVRRPDGRLGLEDVPALWDDIAPALRDGMIDVLVVMRRFQQEDLLSRWLDDDRVNRPLIDRLAGRIWDLHRTAQPHLKEDPVDELSSVMDETVACLRLLPSLFRESEIKHLDTLWRAHLRAQAPLLAERNRQGRVRWCHGDMHTANVCLLEGQPYLFDAIEFSAALSCVDCLYDLAFLLMDIRQHGQKRWASVLLNRYLDLSGDYGGVPLLPLFQSVRAGIRAHVVGAQGVQSNANDDQDRARSYVRAAEALLGPQAPRLVATGGLSGSGKSRMARELAPFLGQSGAVVVRSDAIRKHLAGVPLDHRLGPDGYTAAMTAKTYEILYATCRRLLQSGVRVIADAVFARPEERAAIAAIAEALNVPFHGLWLHTSVDEAIRRIQTRTGDASDATPAVLLAQREYDIGPVDWTRIDASGPKDATLKAGLRAVGLAEAAAGIPLSCQRPFPDGTGGV